jgi:NAD(P)-dependent dehydrogenase (short-subunit alcohol dehydrogenase family)
VLATGAWGPDDISDLTGRTVLVTGANTGIGYEAAIELAAHGAHVVLACRNLQKGRQAADRVIGYRPGASVEVLELDLSSLDAVRTAADRFASEHDRLDVLINNAGVMGTPYLMSADGYELQFATNHLGHFALTGLLLDTLLTTSGSRVVTVSSHGHRQGHLDFSNLQFDHGGYTRSGAYANSKLANLLFTYELERRLRATDTTTIALAVHPGWTRSSLVANGPTIGVSDRRSRLYRAFARLGGQSTPRGALPTLYAATSPDVRGGQYVGPGGLAQLYGPPVIVGSTRRSKRVHDAARLFEVSEVLTGIHYDFGVTDAAVPR